MGKKVIKVTQKGLGYRKWDRSKVSLQMMSKSNLHNFFADKMAAFSAIIGYILEKAKHSYSEHAHVPNPFAALYNKLINMRAGFLNKYHRLNFDTREGMNIETQKVKMLYDHIYKFEENVVSEIITRRDLIDLNKRDHLQI